jgi:SAM-dependent methyltransferase
LVTCRVAIHHFADAYRFVCEAARVLKRGGQLMIHDHLLPEQAADMAYLEAFERLRDPSHGQAFNESEWRGLLLDADLEVTHIETLRRRANLEEWAARQGRPAAVVERLQVLMAQAPDGVREWVRPSAAGTVAAEFDHVYVLIVGRKRG